MERELAIWGFPALFIAIGAICGSFRDPPGTSPPAIVQQHADHVAVGEDDKARVIKRLGQFQWELVDPQRLPHEPTQQTSAEFDLAQPGQAPRTMRQQLGATAGKCWIMSPTRLAS